MCLFPKIIFNKKYLNNKKNGGIIPAVFDERTLYIPVGCGNCIECRNQTAMQWKVRLNEEIRTNTNAHFVTLTFSETALDYWTQKATKTMNINKIEENEIAKTAVRNFLENWRKHHKKSVRHWLITELGHTNTERIHIHGLIWTDKKDEIDKIWNTEHTNTETGEIFTNGYTHIGYCVNEKTINYIIKYVTKIDKDHKGYKPKIMTSAGIGSGYLNRIDKNINKYNGKDTKEYYRTKTGTKLNLPIYYRNKLYTDEEREKLWINKLNKEERWICKEKIDISQGDEKYFNLLSYYQRKNKRLGYGDDSNEWELKSYKKQRKNLKRRNKKNSL